MPGKVNGVLPRPFDAYVANALMELMLGSGQLRAPDFGAKDGIGPEDELRRLAWVGDFENLAIRLAECDRETLQSVGYLDAVWMVLLVFSPQSYYLCDEGIKKGVFPPESLTSPGYRLIAPPYERTLLPKIAEALGVPVGAPGSVAPSISALSLPGRDESMKAYCALAPFAESAIGRLAITRWSMKVNRNNAQTLVKLRGEGLTGGISAEIQGLIMAFYISGPRAFRSHLKQAIERKPDRRAYLWQIESSLTNVVAPRPLAGPIGDKALNDAVGLLETAMREAVERG